MSKSDEDHEKEETELGKSIENLDIPKPFKYIISGVSIALISAYIWVSYRYLSAPKEAISPKEFGLNNAFLFSLASLLITWLPWKQLGLRITRIGFIEFAKVVERQATEHSEELGFIESRLIKLEEAARNASSTAGIIENSQEPELKALIVRYFKDVSPKAISPTRMKFMAEKTRGFEKFNEFELQFVRRIMNQLVAEGKLTTSVSQMGNTLFKMKES